MRGKTGPPSSIWAAWPGLTLRAVSSRSLPGWRPSSAGRRMAAGSFRSPCPRIPAAQVHPFAEQATAIQPVARRPFAIQPVARRPFAIQPFATKRGSEVPVPVNLGLADVSNGLLLSTVVIYALAMLAYACDLAFGHRAVAATAPARVPELVGAVSGAPASGGDTTVGAGAGAGDTVPATPGHRAAGLWMRTAFTLTCVGLATHITGILTRGLSEHRVPWGNMYEFIMAISCMAVIVLVAVAIRYQAYSVGLFVMVPVVFALGLAVTVVYTPAGALVPALQSYWIAIHVTAMIVASGLYIVGAVVTVMYLAVDRYQRRTAAGLPSRIGGIIRSEERRVRK